MNPKYLKNLEFDKIVAMAVERAVCPETRALMLDEQPQTRPEDVRYLLAQTDTLARILLKNGHPRLSACEGADLAVGRAAKGGMLSMGELLNVAGALRNFGALTDWFAGDRPEGQSTAPVDDLFFSITPQPHLHRAIVDAILSDTEMADNASDELYSLRRKIRVAESSIRDKLDAIVKSQTNSKYLQEALVSIRNGRYVVPVKAEHRGEISGVIHDVSQSGGTIFVEPSAVVEANAKIMQLRNAEQAEIELILSDFTQQVAGIAPSFEAGWSAMLEIDKRLAKAELGLAMNGIAPAVNDTMAFHLVKARHPLLDKATAVPVDIKLGGEYDTLIITGPNTGGKTVSLKTAGLLSVMAQTGYLLPAHDSTSVCVFDQVLVDIGDEQSIEQSLSTFSGHMKNITGILRGVDSCSLVLLDELGAGTDPAEGAALAISIIERLRGGASLGRKAGFAEGETAEPDAARTRDADAEEGLAAQRPRRGGGPLIMATTHYAELKMFALDKYGVQNAGSEFDIETLRPTYRLIVGVPGRSNAFLIGEKLGIPAEVIANARRHMSSEQQRFETVLGQLEDLKLELKAQEEEIENLRYAAANQLEDARKKRDALIKQGEDELAAARQKSKGLADEVERAAYNLMDEMKRLEKDQRVANAQKAQRARQIARSEAGALAKRSAEGEAALPSRFEPLEKAEAGDEVWVPEMGKAGIVTAGPDKAGLVALRVGAIKTKLPLAGLAALPKSAAAQKNKPGSTAAPRRGDATLRTPGTELNLLGKTVDEALMDTDQFIDSGVMSGLGTLYIIHGRGTGALRSAISQHLKGHRSVKSYRLGRYGEGEDGVTVVELK